MRLLWFFCFAAALGLAAPHAARAASISYVLDQTNIDQAPITDGTPYVRVTIDDNTPNALTFTVSLLSSLTSIASSSFGTQDFSFNVVGAGAGTLQDSGSVAGQWTLPSGWSANVAPPPNQADGFGSFEVQVSGNGSNRQSPLVFSLNGTGLTINSFAEASTGTANQGNVFFATHVAGFNGPSGTTSGFFGGSTVPEPAVSLLVLVALGLCARHARERVR
jgi:hypothetical protein